MVILYAVAISFVASAVPTLPILVTCLVVSAVAWVAFLTPGRGGVAVLWRVDADHPIYATPLHRVLAVSAGLMSLIVFNLLVMASGGRVFAPADAGMPFTNLLGALAGWFLPGLILVTAYRLFLSWRNDPARTTPPTIHVGGGDPAEVKVVSKLIRSWGWKVVAWPRLREAGTVGVEVVPPEQSEATEFDPRWPLKVSVADLRSGEVKQRLDRRDEIRVRRQLFRGLSKLFKRAAMFKGPGGGGCGCPHWWFVEGMGREDSDGEEATPPTMVGPPYARAIPPRARQHAHRVLRAAHVDMIFVEDGVGFRKVEKVLRVMTELFDVHGGRRRAEEMHFRGLPKVRVMIHDYSPGNPFRSDVYPEPKFDDLSRVRVLHVFRDRGGEEEEVEPPYDFSWTPAPAGVAD